MTIPIQIMLTGLLLILPSVVVIKSGKDEPEWAKKYLGAGIILGIPMVYFGALAAIWL